MEKVQLKNSWRLFYKGDGYAVTPVVRIADREEEAVEVVMNNRKLKISTCGEFYGLPPESTLEEACIVPGILFEFQIRVLKSKYRVALSRCPEVENAYSLSMYIKGEDYETNIVGKILSPDEVRAIMQHFEDTFNPYPFLQLPFGNCFSGM